MKQQPRPPSWKFNLVIISLFGLLILSLVLTLCFGAMKINPVHTYQILAEKLFGFSPYGDSLPSLAESNIIWKIRLPRILLGLAAGAGLALCGTIMQATVQNPL